MQTVTNKIPFRVLGGTAFQLDQSSNHNNNNNNTKNDTNTLYRQLVHPTRSSRHRSVVVVNGINESIKDTPHFPFQPLVCPHAKLGLPLAEMLLQFDIFIRSYPPRWSQDGIALVTVGKYVGSVQRNCLPWWSVNAQFTRKECKRCSIMWQRKTFKSSEDPQISFKSHWLAFLL